MPEADPTQSEIEPLQGFNLQFTIRSPRADDVAPLLKQRGNSL